MSKRPESTVGAAARMEFATYTNGLKILHAPETLHVKQPEIDERKLICDYIQHAEGSDISLLGNILLGNEGKCIDRIWGWIKEQGEQVSNESISKALKALA